MREDNLIIITALIFILIVITLSILEGERVTDKEKIIVREASVAGIFYPSNKEELQNLIYTYIDNVKSKFLPNVKALVMPHAGYVYSGITASYGAWQLIGRRYREVIVIAPSHYAYFFGFSIANVTHYSTPLGIVKLSEKVNSLRKEKYFNFVKKAHEKEHAIEVEIPFLQATLENFTLIPIVVGVMNYKELANIIDKYVDEDTLIIASSDMSHYYPYEHAVSVDIPCSKAIANLNINNFSKCEACGKIPILTLMEVAKKRGWKGNVLDYRNSGDTTGIKNKVVGYASIAFYEPILSDVEEEFLLKVARDVIKDSFKEEKKTYMLTENVLKKSGCFVTLTKNGMLRGCIGTIPPIQTMYECVKNNAYNAAFKDPRFKPLKLDEVDEIKIEISILTKPTEIKYKNTQDLLRKIRRFADGIILNYNGLQATFLPQVWNQIPEKEKFLAHLCLKAGASSDCWKKGAKVYRYSAYIFEEH